MRPLPGRFNDQGFTLIEVLVAATLLIVSVFASLAMVDNATKTTAVSKQRDVANAVAQEMIERATSGRYSATRNDLTDVDTAATLAGPADRMRASLDPDNDQSSTAVTPATVRSGTQPVNVPQTWKLTRKNTVYSVSYRACTASDLYQQVKVAGPFDCDRPTTDPGGGDGTTTGNCSVGVIPPSSVDPSNPGQLTVKFQVLGIAGLSACVGALAPPFSTALSSSVCTLLGSSPLLNSVRDTLLGTNGLLTNLLGGLAGATVGACSASQIDTALAGAQASIGTSTRVAVTVAWTDAAGHDRSIAQSTVIRRAST